MYEALTKYIGQFEDVGTWIIDRENDGSKLTGAIRAERFCDGAFASFVRSGAIDRWLRRLKEIDES